MKKISVVMLLSCAVILYACAAFAATIGSTIPDSKQDGLSVSVGAEGNFIFEKDLESSGSMISGKIEDTNQDYAIAVIQPFKFMTAYGKVGASNLQAKIDWNVNRSQTVKFDYGMISGGGVNLLYDLGNNLGLGLDNQALWSHNEADSVSGNNNPRLTSKGSYDTLEFQSTVYAKYDLELGQENILTPYVGGSYLFNKSYIDDTIQVTDDTYIFTYGDAENEDNFGPVVGLNYKMGKNLLLGVEGRFVTETSVAGRATYKF